MKRAMLWFAASAASIALPLATTSGGSGSNYANAAALFNGIKQAATDSATGVVELETTAETQGGAGTARAVTSAGLHATMLGGVGQAWVNVTPSRALSTTYTNTSGHPKQVNLLLTNGSGSTQITATVGGVAINAGITPGAAANSAFGSFTVPIGATYSVAMPGTPTLVFWGEL